MSDKKELNFEELDEISGGGKKNKYKNSNDGGGQISQQGEGNKFKNSGNMNTGNGNNIIQNNDIHDNEGDVKVGSPINLNGGQNNTYNLNF